MKTFTYTIKDENGIHARPAGILVKSAAKYGSDITIEWNGKSASAKRLFAVMGMGIKQGSEITVKISGEDEDTAAAELENFFKENL